MRPVYLLVVAACGSAADPAIAIDRLDPASGKASEDVRIRIEGTFHVPLTSDLAGPTTAGALVVLVDDVPLTDLVWQDEHLIEGTVSAGLAPGRHDVTVELAERTAVLPGGYVVFGDAVKLAFATPPATVAACTCSGLVTIEVRDAADQPVPLAVVTSIGLTSSSPALAFHPAAMCDAATTAVVVEAGRSSTDFQFTAGELGSTLLTAAAPGLGTVVQLESIPTSSAQWFADADGDGFGDPAVASIACVRPTGFVAIAGDCDDDPATCGAACFPGNPAPDLCDGWDQDCSPATPDGSGDPQVGVACDGPDTDLCLEGTTSCQGGALVCSDTTGSTVEGPPGSPSCSDLVDNDCDGATDLADPDCWTCVSSVCNSAGGTCIANTCVIDNNTTASVTCPPGMNCQVLCDTTGACTGGVFCGSATSCDVRCVGASACKTGGVDCGQAATCTVRCEGASACEHGLANGSIDCRTSTCTATCTGAGSCKDGVNTDPPGGSCTAHCCNGGCSGGTATCVVDSVCN